MCIVCPHQVVYSTWYQSIVIPFQQQGCGKSCFCKGVLGTLERSSSCHQRIRIGPGVVLSAIFCPVLGAECFGWPTLLLRTQIAFLTRQTTMTYQSSSKWHNKIHSLSMPSRRTDQGVRSEKERPYRQDDSVCLCLPKLLPITVEKKNCFNCLTSHIKFQQTCNNTLKENLPQYLWRKNYLPWLRFRFHRHDMGAWDSLCTCTVCGWEGRKYRTPWQRRLC